MRLVYDWKLKTTTSRPLSTCLAYQKLITISSQLIPVWKVTTTQSMQASTKYGDNPNSYSHTYLHAHNANE